MSGTCLILFYTHNIILFTSIHFFPEKEICRYIKYPIYPFDCIISVLVIVVSGRPMSFFYISASDR